MKLKLQSDAVMPSAIIHYYELVSNKVLRNTDIFDLVLFREVLIISEATSLFIEKSVLTVMNNE